MKRGRSGIIKSPAQKKARRDAVESMMRVMDKVASGEAVMPRGTRYVVPYSGMQSAMTRSLRPGELKGVDTILTVAGPVIATTGTNGDVFTLNLVAPGTASYNRVGRKIAMKNLRIRFLANYKYAPIATTLSIQGALMRCVLVYDRQPSGAVPTFETIFGTTLQDGTEAATVLSPVRYDNTARFIVLSDNILNGSVDPGQSAGGTENEVAVSYHFDKFIPLKGLETVYSGQSSPCTIADISSGGLYLYFRATSSTDEFIDWSVSSTSFARLRFVD